MDSITEGKLEQWFKQNKGPMEVDIVVNGEGQGTKLYNDIYEILTDYDGNGETVMYFPIA